MTEQSMINRVAIALCKADGKWSDIVLDIYDEKDPYTGYCWADYRKQARTAIEAMREPTHEMEDAAWRETVIGDGGGNERAYFELEWRAAINAALAEQPDQSDETAHPTPP